MCPPIKTQWLKHISTAKHTWIRQTKNQKCGGVAEEESGDCVLIVGVDFQIAWHLIIKTAKKRDKKLNKQTQSIKWIRAQPKNSVPTFLVFGKLKFKKGNKFW